MRELLANLLALTGDRKSANLRASPSPKRRGGTKPPLSALTGRKARRRRQRAARKIQRRR